MKQELTTRVWTNIAETKFKCIYIEKLIERFQIWNTVIAVFLTITSIGAIAGLLKSDQAQIIWAMIIVLAQIVNSLKPVFSFERKIKVLIEMRAQLYDTEVEFERLYYDIYYESFDLSEIKNRFFNNYEKVINALKPIPNEYFKQRRCLRKKSIDEMKQYIEKNYTKSTETSHETS